jgi:hypothetical protein
MGIVIKVIGIGVVKEVRIELFLIEFEHLLDGGAGVFIEQVDLLVIII